MVKKTAVLAFSGGVIMMAAAAARAATPTPATDTGSDAIPEVTVTAERTESTASKTPIALSVISGDQLVQDGVVNAQALDQVAPGVAVSNSNHGISIEIRGVNTTDPTSKGTQAVAYSMDGIPVLRPEEMQLGFFDLDRVEVLRGPQGTLYGASSTAGAVNVISAKPKGDFDASATTEVGNYDTRRGTAMVNMPLTSNFWVRAAVSYNYRDGFLTPDLFSKVENAAGFSESTDGGTQRKLDDEDNMAERLTALWKINDQASLTVTGNWGYMGGTGSTNSAVWDELKGPTSTRFDVYYNPYAGVYNDHFGNYNWELNWDFGPVHLTYDGAEFHYYGAENYNPSTSDPATTGDSFDWAIYNIDIKTRSHEVRLQNANPQRLEWVAGLNYLSEDNHEEDENWASLVSCSPSLAAACSGTPNPDIVGPNYHKTEGAFGQINFHVTDALKLTGGLRYTTDDMYRHATLAAGGTPPGGWLNAQGGLCGPASGACVGPPGAILLDSGSEHDSKLTWRIAADYTITPGQLVYGYVATGFKAGGFNDLDPTRPPTPGSAGTPAPYGPENNTAFEVGYKGHIGSDALFTSDFYYYDYSKFQLTGATFLTPGVTGSAPLVLIYTTIVPATLYGWENELKWNVTPDDQFGVSLVLAEGYFNSGANQAMVGFIYSDRVPWGGKTMDNMPKISSNVNYEHRFHLTNGGQIAARLTSKISSAYYESDYSGQGNPFSPPGLGASAYSLAPAQYKQGGYTRTNFDLIYRSPTDKFELDGYVRNIENKVQILTVPQNIETSGPGAEFAVGSAAETVRVSDPMTFGVRMTVRY